MKGSFITSPKPFAIIRYAEVLLEYVEALNNVTGTVTVTTPDMTGTDVEVTVSRDVQEMAKYFNMIRYRVGLPGPALSDMNDANRFEQIIRNERQVELFNEGYRYFDTFCKQPGYPFGYGLSYTTFSLNGCRGALDGETLTFSVEVANTGRCAGQEVVLLYASAPVTELDLPAKELTGFK